MPGSQALHFFGMAALVLGLLLLCVGRGAIARGLLAAQVAAVALGAAVLALAQQSVLSGIAALVLIVGHGALAVRGPVPSAPTRPAGPILGGVAIGLLLLALPQAAGPSREAVVIGVGTALLGVVASCRAGWHAAGALACANGVALAALMLGDAETALAGVLLSLGGAASGALAWPRAESA